MTSRTRRDWSALLYNYDELQSASEDSCQYCLNEREVQMILSSIDYFRWKNRYESKTGQEIDTDLIEHWADQLEGKLMDTDCGAEASRRAFEQQQKQDKIINGQRRSAYDGTPTSINPNCPTTNFNGSNNQVGNDALCSAVNDYVRSRVLVTLNLYRMQLAGAAMAAGLGAWLGGVWGLIGGGIAVLYAAGQLIPVEEAAADDEALDDIACSLTNALENDAISQANFIAAINGLPANTGTRATITTILQASEDSLDNYLMFLDLLGEWTIRASVGDVVCPCDDVWCYEFNFPTAGLEGWSDAPSANGGGGILQVGVGIAHTDEIDTVSNPDIAGRVVYQEMLIPGGTTITRYEMTFDVTYGTYDQTTGRAEWLIANGSLLYSKLRNQTASGNDKVAVWTGTVGNVTNLQFGVRSSRDSSAPYAYSGSVLVKKIRLEGTGVNPFGSDNCP